MRGFDGLLVVQCVSEGGAGRVELRHLVLIDKFQTSRNIMAKEWY